MLTMAPDPTTTESPIVRPGIIIALAPMKQRLPILVFNLRLLQKSCDNTIAPDVIYVSSPINIPLGFVLSILAPNEILAVGDIFILYSLVYTKCLKEITINLINSLILTICLILMHL